VFNSHYIPTARESSFRMRAYESETLVPTNKTQKTRSCNLWNPSDPDWLVQVVLGVCATTFLVLFIYYAHENAQGRVSHTTSFGEEVASGSPTE
jgi:hypothetical protein